MLVESDVHVSFMEDHDVAPPLHTNTQPLVKDKFSLLVNPTYI